MKKNIKTLLLLCSCLLLTGCNSFQNETKSKDSDESYTIQSLEKFDKITRERERERKDCEERYTYEKIDYDRYQEPHYFKEYDFDKDKEVAFIFKYDGVDSTNSENRYDANERGFIITGKGEVFLYSSDIEILNFFEFIDSMNFKSLEPAEILDIETVRENTELLKEFDTCKPVNIDRRGSYTEEEKNSLEICAVQDGKVIRLDGFSDGVRITTTDENIKKVVVWINTIKEDIHIYNSENN